MPAFHGGSVLLAETLLAELHTADTELTHGTRLLEAIRPYLEELDARKRLVAELWTRFNEVEAQLGQAQAQLHRGRRTAKKLREAMHRANGGAVLHEATRIGMEEEPDVC